MKISFLVFLEILTIYKKQINQMVIVDVELSLDYW